MIKMQEGGRTYTEYLNFKMSRRSTKGAVNQVSFSINDKEGRKRWIGRRKWQWKKYIGQNV